MFNSGEKIQQREIFRKCWFISSETSHLSSLKTVLVVVLIMRVLIIIRLCTIITHKSFSLWEGVPLPHQAS